MKNALAPQSPQLLDAHTQPDWIDEWHFDIDDARGDDHGRVRMHPRPAERLRQVDTRSAPPLALNAPTDPLPPAASRMSRRRSHQHTVAISVEELMDVRRDLQRSAETVRHAIARIDALLELRLSA